MDNLFLYRIGAVQKEMAVTRNPESGGGAQHTR